MNIIEDCSPYFIRFNLDNVEKIISMVGEYQDTGYGFVHHRYPLEVGASILANIPFADKLRLNPNRVSLFITKPGASYRAHKDGLNIRWGFNINVSILDQECVTSWYSDEDLSIYPIDNLKSNTSRECEGFVRANHTPLKSMIAKQGECVLFNTDIFHDFDNSKSKNTRIILTFRDRGELTFNDAKSILFGMP